MANAGRVEVTITAVGEDKLSKMLGLLQQQSEKTSKSFERTASATKSYNDSATGLADKLTALAEKQKNLADIGLDSGAAYAKTNKEIVKTVDDLTMAIEEELAALKALGAEQGPLGVARRAQLDGIKALTAAQAEATKAQDAAKESTAVATTTTTQAKDAVGGLAGKLGATLKPLDEVRGKFSAFTSNVMFFGGALFGAAATLTGILTSLQSKAWAQFSEDIKGIADTFQRTADLIYEIDVLLGKRPARTALEDASRKLLAEWESLTAKIENGRNAIAQSEAQLAALARVGMSWTSAYQAEQQRLIKAADILNGLERERNLLGEKQVLILREQERSVLAQIRAIAGKAISDAQALIAPTPKPLRLPGFNRPKPDELPGAQIRMDDLDVMAQLEDSFAGITIAEREFIDLSGLFGKALRDDVVQGFRDIRDEGLEAAEAIIKVSDALSDSMSAAFPDIGKGLGEVTLHMQRYRDELEKLDEQVRLGADAAAAQQKATDSLTMAVIGSGTAIAASVAKTLGGLQLEYAVRSAGEFAAGVATSFTNPAEAASHFSASVLYGIAAAKAGGGGGGGGARSGGGGAGGGTGGGPSKTKANEGGGVIVYNFNQLTAEGFGVKKAVRQLNARRDRSGYAQRAGV